MKNNALRVAGIQAIVAITGATAAYLLDNPLAAESFLCGSCASLANGLLLAWHGRQRLDAVRLEAAGQLKAMYRSALERYAATILLLVAGMELFEPLLVLAGFAAGQVGLVLARLLCNVFEN